MPAPVLCVAAHPDDIEFMMAGTLALLAQAGHPVHMLNVADGACGTAELDPAAITRLRAEEAQASARLLGATWHPPRCPDLHVLYTPELVAELCAVVREVDPEIVLLPSPQDYMEDHSNTSRLMVTATFARNMRNFASSPPRPPVGRACAVYHALPYGLQDPLRHPLRPDFCVEITSVLELKRAMLACHRSQREWLDLSQGPGSYLDAQAAMSRQVGALAGVAHAEGWRRHLHLGFGPADFDPLAAALTRHLHSIV